MSNKPLATIRFDDIVNSSERSKQMANEHIIAYRIAKYDSAKVRRHTPNAHVALFHFVAWRIERTGK